MAQGLEENFIPAEKSHKIGEDILNTLFKNDMIFIYEGMEEAKLSAELSTLSHETPKRHAKDDLCDALRYAVSKIPWDFSGIIGRKSDDKDEPEKKLSPMQQQVKERRDMMREKEDGDWRSVEEELEEWNELAGGY